MLPLVMALMWRHCIGNAVYNLSHKSRNYLFNMIMLPIRECWFLFVWPENTSWTNSRSRGDFRPSFVVILLTKLLNGHAGSIHLARLKCTQLCWRSSRWIFWSCSSQGSTRDQTQLKSYNSGVFVQIQSWTDQQVSRKKNKRCAIIQNELSLMSIYFVACNFKMIVAVDVLYNRLY